MRHLQACVQQRPSDISRSLARFSAFAVVSIEAPPSMYPPKKFCDLTGQLARYTDPKTRLHYADAAAFAALRRLTPEGVQQRLALRRAATVLK